MIQSSEAETIEAQKMHDEDSEPQLPTDGRENRWDWETKYPKEARRRINLESIYLTVLLILGLVALVMNYVGLLYNWYDTISYSVVHKTEIVFLKELYCAIFGFLGGTVYGMKILYKAVARGFWHKDRLLWRLFTPWTSLVLSIVIASMMSGTTFNNNVYAVVIIGFFVGYFSESAIGKLYAIARVLFS